MTILFTHKFLLINNRFRYNLRRNLLSLFVFFLNFWQVWAIFSWPRKGNLGSKTSQAGWNSVTAPPCVPVIDLHKELLRVSQLLFCFQQSLKILNSKIRTFSLGLKNFRVWKFKGLIWTFFYHFVTFLFLWFQNSNNSPLSASIFDHIFGIWR